MNDKLLHFTVSLALVVLLSLLMPCAVAEVVTLAVGVMKELYDKYVKRTRIDVLDLVADALGAGTGLIVATLIS